MKRNNRPPRSPSSSGVAHKNAKGRRLPIDQMHEKICSDNVVLVMLTALVADKLKEEISNSSSRGFSSLQTGKLLRQKIIRDVVEEAIDGQLIRQLRECLKSEGSRSATLPSSKPNGATSTSKTMRSHVNTLRETTASTVASQGNEVELDLEGSAFDLEPAFLCEGTQNQLGAELRTCSKSLTSYMEESEEALAGSLSRYFEGCDLVQDAKPPDIASTVDVLSASEECDSYESDTFEEVGGMVTFTSPAVTGVKALSPLAEERKSELFYTNEELEEFMREADEEEQSQKHQIEAGER